MYRKKDQCFTGVLGSLVDMYGFTYVAEKNILILVWEAQRE